MEKYTKAQMEVIEFEAEDVITTSGGPDWCTNFTPPHSCWNDLS